MLSPQFYSQITVCSLCKGWGVDSVPPKKNSAPCKECGSLGVFLAQTDKTFIWGMPTFIDFKRRAKIKIIKLVILALAILFFIFVYYFISQIQIPRFNISPLK